MAIQVRHISDATADVLYDTLRYVPEKHIKRIFKKYAHETLESEDQLVDWLENTDDESFYGFSTECSQHEDPNL